MEEEDSNKQGHEHMAYLDPERRKLLNLITHTPSVKWAIW